MKKIKYILTLICLLLIPTINVNASSASISCSSSGTVTVGSTITVTFTGNYSGDNRDLLLWNVKGINWDSSKLNSNFGGSNLNISEDGSFSKSFSFTATNVGKATVQLVNVDVSDGNQLIGPAGTSNSCTINVVAPSTSNSNKSTNNSSSSSSNKNVVNKSSDNNLKSLSVDNVELVPKFDKDTLEYKVELSSDTKKIKINAEANDSTAKVSGVGEIDVNEGQNKIEIVVTAENSATKTYVINAYVKEKNPIIIKISKEEYTVLRKITDIKEPNNFSLSKISIQGEEIEAYYNGIINLRLVALKNKAGDVNLYIYDEDTEEYIKYIPLITNSLHVIVTNLDKNITVPYRYSKSKFIYNGNEIDGYAYSEYSDFRLIYATNAETGEKNFYLYDMKENTLQRFYNDQVNIYVELTKKCKIAFIIFGCVLGIFTIIIIILLSKNVKFKTKYLNSKLNSIDNPSYNSKDIKYQNLEGTKTMDKIDIDDIDNKKKKKTFLDE